MTNYITLLKIFLKTTEITPSEKKRSKLFYSLMGTAILMLIMLPAGALVGFVTYALSLAVLDAGGSTQAANIVLHIIAILSVIFGFNVIVNIFYFSNDIENLLPLPLKPHEIVGAKYTYSLLSENIMEFILTIGVCAGYMFASGFSVTGVIGSIIGILTVPILPLAYCGIISVVLMFLTHSIKNRDFLNKVTGAGTALLIIGALVALVGVNDFNAEAFAVSVTEGDSTFLNVMNIIFPQIPLLMSGINGSIVDLLIYLGVNVLALAVFLFIASKMYIKGVSDVNTAKTKKDVSDTQRAINRSKENGVLKSYIKKEFLILFRTPAFFMDCIAVNLLWPVFFAVIIILQGQTNFMSGVIESYMNGNVEMILFVTLGVIGISVVISAINSIASAGISREGRHFEFMMYIPVELKTQLHAKAIVSFVVSGSGMIIYIIAFNWYCLLTYGWVDDPIITFLMPFLHMLIALVSVIFASYFGLFMDTINPKLVWDDEINALRGNYNVFINTAVVLAAVGGVCVISLVLDRLINSGTALAVAILLITVLALMGMQVCLKKGEKNLMSIE